MTLSWQDTRVPGRSCCRTPRPEGPRWTPGRPAVRAQTPEDTGEGHQGGRKGGHSSSRTQECLITHAAGSQAPESMEGTWVSPLYETGFREIWCSSVRGEIGERLGELGVGSASAAPTAGVCNRDPALRPVHRGLAAHRTRRLGGTDSLEGQYLSPPGLRRALRSMAAWEREDWSVQIPWHSLTRIGEEDRGSWARTWEVLRARRAWPTLRRPAACAVAETLPSHTLHLGG